MLALQVPKLPWELSTSFGEDLGLTRIRPSSTPLLLLNYLPKVHTQIHLLPPAPSHTWEGKANAIFFLVNIY